MPGLRSLIIDLTVMVAAAIVLAALGPFGTFQIGSFGARLAYWLPAALLGYAIFRPMGAVIEWMASRFGFPRRAAMVAAVLLAAVPATVGIALFGGQRWASMPDAATLFPLYLNVALIGALVMGLFEILRSSKPSAVPPLTDTPAAARPPFFDRLPPGFPLPLIALEMEDHYLRIHGQEGRSALILMRMRDALTELQGVDGTQVHRSWWVARGAVVGRRREGRNLVLSLTGGLDVPVARDRAAALKKDGWI